jgi:hypothetical protein
MVLMVSGNSFTLFHYNAEVLIENHIKVVSVSCFFGHYPSSQFLNKITTFQRLALSPFSGDKERGGVILSGGSLRQR